MPKNKPFKTKKTGSKELELKSASVFLQPSAIKILEALSKGLRHTSALSKNKAVEMKKVAKEHASAEAKKNSKIWIAKMPPAPASLYEVVGQECMRFLSIIAQPKSRFWVNSGSIGVISEKLSFNAIEKRKKQTFSPEFMKGLGASTLLSLYTNETDLKLDHIDAKCGTKIDGDWMFSSLSLPETFAASSNITAAELNRLPYVDKYNAHNWLDQIEESKRAQGKLLFNNLSVTDNKYLREGINQSIMHILLLPDPIIKDFVHAYINKTDVENKMSTFLIDRKKQLLNASLQNKDFVEYVVHFTDADKNIYLRKIKSFKPYKKFFLINEDNYKIKSEIATLLTSLQTQAKKIQSLPAKEEKSIKNERMQKRK
jgi:hypothetical protein